MGVSRAGFRARASIGSALFRPSAFAGRPIGSSRAGRTAASPACEAERARNPEANAADEHPTDLRPRSSPPDRLVVPFDHSSGVDHNGGGHAMLPTNQEYLVRAKRTIPRFRVFQTAASAAHDARRRVCTRETIDGGFFVSDFFLHPRVFLQCATTKRNTRKAFVSDLASTNPKRHDTTRSVRTRRTVTPPRITAAR